MTLPPGLPEQLFTLGVASGDPLPDSVILWTRLVPDPLALGGMPDAPVPVEWEVAADEAFGDIVAKGTASAEPAFAHSVHIDAVGLAPDSWYWYRFTVGDRVSPTGRTRTAPADGAAVERLRFAFATCQEWESGYYAAHRHMADDDIDLVVFLGDYIYEGDPGNGPLRSNAHAAPVDLDGYRLRFGQYKSDPDLQAVHARFPWVLTWDDHEVDNDYAGDSEEASNPQPDAVAFRARRAAAYQAYYEHQPIRIDPPSGPDVTIYRDLAWGSPAPPTRSDSRGGTPPARHRVALPSRPDAAPFRAGRSLPAPAVRSPRRAAQ
jgi:alkaline phosphatase D